MGKRKERKSGMTISRDIIEKAIQGVEAKKHAYRQTREGTVVSFLIHPDDVPQLLTQELSISAIGARYLLGIVRLSEESDYPVVPEEITIGERAMRRASMLCRDTDYQEWLRLNSKRWKDVDENIEDNTEYSAEVIRYVCDILSRRELKTDKEAQEKLREHVEEYKKEKRMMRV